MIETCRACGQKNKVPAKRLHDNAKCGRCGEAMGPVDAPIAVSSEAEFDDIVASAQVPVLVDFWAAWCGPCRMVAPEVERVAKRVAGRALVLKVDTEQHPRLAARFNVRGIPNFAVFRSGKVAHQQAGAVSGQVMEGWLKV